jgi:hypothetical protein
MSDFNSSQAPVAQNVRSRQSAGQKDFVPPGRKPSTPEEVAAAKAQREAKRTAAAERTRGRIARLRAWGRKNRLALIITGSVVIVLALVGVVEAISANSGSPTSTVQKYIAAMNSKDPSVFADTDLFPLPDGVELLSPEILAQEDTSLVDPQVKVDVTSSGARVTITTSNLASQIGRASCRERV